jgi:hypothetical protein
VAGRKLATVPKMPAAIFVFIVKLGFQLHAAAVSCLAADAFVAENT